MENHFIGNRFLHVYEVTCIIKIVDPHLAGTASSNVSWLLYFLKSDKMSEACFGVM